MVVAWQTAVLTRCDPKKFPKLETLLSGRGGKQTIADKREKLQQLADQLGKRLRPVKKGGKGRKK